MGVRNFSIRQHWDEDGELLKGEDDDIHFKQA
jgi:hypothetical protein